MQCLRQMSQSGCQCIVQRIKRIRKVHSTTDKTNTKHYASWRCSILEVALPASPNRDAPPAVDALRAAAAACSDGLLCLLPLKLR